MVHGKVGVLDAVVWALAKDAKGKGDLVAHGGPAGVDSALPVVDVIAAPLLDLVLEPRKTFGIPVDQAVIVDAVVKSDDGRFFGFC